jgi:hypothetical protein
MTPQFQAAVEKFGPRFKADLGLTNLQVCGIFGNLAVESGQFKLLQEVAPTVKGSRGGYAAAVRLHGASVGLVARRRVGAVLPRPVFWVVMVGLSSTIHELGDCASRGWIEISRAVGRELVEATTIKAVVGGARLSSRRQYHDERGRLERSDQPVQRPHLSFPSERSRRTRGALMVNQSLIVDTDQVQQFRSSAM